MRLATLLLSGFRTRTVLNHCAGISTVSLRLPHGCSLDHFCHPDLPFLYQDFWELLEKNHNLYGGWRHGRMMISRITWALLWIQFTCAASGNSFCSGYSELSRQPSGPLSPSQLLWPLTKHNMTLRCELPQFLAHTLTHRLLSATPSVQDGASVQN